MIGAAVRSKAMNKKVHTLWQPYHEENGMVKGRQLYKCHACKKQLLGRDR